MKQKININFLEKYIAHFVNDIEYDLMADVDDQRFHHFCS